MKRGQALFHKPRTLRWMQGSIVALITPFRKGRVDVETLRKLVEMHVKAGTSALLPCGTTGESSTLSHEEHDQVIEVVIRAARGRIAVAAGTGSNNTTEALRLTRHAEKAGADGALLIAPYYNKPTQEGLYRHFKTVAESVRIPVIVYNIASRTGVNIDPATFARLAPIRNIAAVKESSGNLEQMARIRLLCGDRIILLSGDDALTLPVLSIGGTGVVSVVANILPKETTRLVAAFRKGNLREARRLYYRLLPITKTLFIETNPAPVKSAMGLMGMIPDASLRLPMVPLEKRNLEKLKAVLLDYKLIR